MKYRIENVSIPEIKGVARPGTQSDASRELEGRRIVAVLEASPATGSSDATLRVLTEEADEVRVILE